MPIPAVALRVKKFRRHFGITAPRVVVRTRLSWCWYAVGAILIVLIAFQIAWSILQCSEVGGTGRELDSLRHRLRELEDELLKLQSTAGTEQNAVQMERSTQQQLLDRIKTLGSENAALKEDMLLFERLIPAVGDGPSIRLENFRVVPDGPQSFRYRVFLAFQSGKQAPEFRGRLQFFAKFSLAGKQLGLLVPAARENSDEFQVEVRHFLSKEGGFELPVGAKLQSVEVRVLQGDTLKAKRLMQL
jgi:hypothetical protein